MFLFIIFTFFGLIFGLLYFFSQQKFSPANLLLGLWCFSIAIAQFYLSPYENKWPLKFWLILLLFFVLFYLAYYLGQKFWNKKIKTGELEQSSAFKSGNKIFFWILTLMTGLCLIANAYIFSRFGTLPILSTLPDKMRFIINREIFGLWEYLALLPRIFIPLSFIYILLGKTNKKWPKILAAINIIIGFLILSLYASRLIIIFALLLCYFSYLILKIKKNTLKKIVSASIIILIVIILISTAIPALRQYITYRDYYTDIEYTAFTYLVDLSKINLPENLNWLIPLYLIPSFNLQAMMRATDYFAWPDLYFGQYSLSTFDSLLKIFQLPQFNIIIPWKTMFLPWWVTATFLFDPWVDFGIAGIVIAAIFWGILLAGVYILANKKSAVFTTLLFAYFSFVAIMSIYTNYLSRPEFYLDLAIILLMGWILKNKKITNER